MSKKKLVQIQRYLIIAILFLLCIALALGILVKYQNSQDVSSVKPDYFIDKQEDLISLNKDHYEIGIFQENEFDNNKSVSILEQKIQEIDDLNTSLNEQNLSNVEQNLSLEQNFILKDANLTQDQNLTFNEDTHLNKISKKPKLAIIIDDMANASQVRGLKALNLKLNPSFFPPDKNHSETPKLALKFDFYMVHLPLAAINYNKPELDTLNPNDSKERIFKKIKQIKKDFKDLRYINNHTGSLFTSNEEAMRKLYEVLKNQNIFFVDSKTIGNSKANKIAKELSMPYIQRDVFLDNEDDVNYVKKQLESAVKLAQKKGFVIAIGHPRKNTFKALEQSKDLLKGVDLVYLSEIYGK
ncbi:divergent polysaccharide deacetylase family protein [Campylobacter jejuni]|uniref:divergent polysaccharide deacetylase family protein n=1 Tax=Campylobacter jejuni TaxID=197 RepID=UPI0006992AFB|nr:divergent polysaccharide deacetylase family protein [Campylobacter jejuni]EAH6956148.1 divergent polysaccharide deacetylase family protein [Campylobacter jejuni]EAH7034592.1 divergent polysaccharide deacetylase family protein [Campylobacter jejuni]EAI1456467.1 divergent polysaccharide deacetylase family protein [Campylobacter jejuni]EAI4427008.1 divergent polysaccharide deacetylase family protein [Campylobacter jejuni]EAI6531144.1 divergent polysaccharide deacetylase family protein [Campylo